MTIDSDNFIYKKGVVEKYADRIRSGEYDYIGPHKPFMSFWNKNILDTIDVDFREHHFQKGDKIKGYSDCMDSYKFLDVMELLSMRFSQKTDKILETPIDDLPEHEHIGRSSPFINFLGDYPKEKTVDDIMNNRGVLKSMIRLNRVSYVYYIFRQTKKYFPYKHYNDYYERMFEFIMNIIGYNLEMITRVIGKRIKIKLPPELNEKENL